jgi:hypothetical protein
MTEGRRGLGRLRREACADRLGMFEAGKSSKQVAGVAMRTPAFSLRTYVHPMDDGLGDAHFLDRAVTVTEPATSV